jgi:hypothetical protein
VKLSFDHIAKAMNRRLPEITFSVGFHSHESHATEQLETKRFQILAILVSHANFIQTFDNECVGISNHLFIFHRHKFIIHLSVMK